MISGGEEKGSKRARRNYTTSEASFCTETVTCDGLEDAIEPQQHLDGLGEKLGEGSSLKQMAEEFGELAFL